MLKIEILIKDFCQYINICIGGANAKVSHFIFNFLLAFAFALHAYGNAIFRKIIGIGSHCY
jgi:hypothetical protein